MKVNRLPWDSAFFDCNVGEFRYMGNLDPLLNASEYDIIYVKSDAFIDFSIPDYDTTLKQLKVVFTKQLSIANEDVTNVYPYKKELVTKEQLYLLSYTSGTYSRFNIDPKVPTIKFQELYRKWIDNSIHNSSNTDTLVYSFNKKVVGFVTFKYEDSSGAIGLIAVDPKEQGKGIGKKLISQVESILFKKGITNLTIPTQLNNTQACEFYKKMGYVIANTQVIYHLWKK